MADFAIGSGTTGQTIQRTPSHGSGSQVQTPAAPGTPPNPATGSSEATPQVQGHPNGAPGNNNVDQLQRGEGREGARNQQRRGHGVTSPMDGAFVRQK